MFINWPGNTISSGEVTVYGDRAQPGVVTFEILFGSSDSWDVRVTRLSPDPGDPQIIDGSTWQRLISMGRSVDNDQYGLINPQKQHTFYELKYTANENLSGQVQRLNAQVVSKLRKFDRNGNFTGYTNQANAGNPALVVMDILTGYSIQNHEDKVGDDYANFDGGWIRNSQIDFNSFVDFKNHCDEKVTYTDHNGQTLERFRYQCNAIIDTDAPIIETCQSILSMCRARLIINKAGKFAIMMDQKRTTPRQLFTPANTWDFNASLDFINQPHALRVNFISPELYYQKASIMVYADGYDEKSATIIEDLETFGCTNWHQAAMYGRFMIAQGVLRREQFTLSVDAEHLVVQVGDRVDLQHDVPGFGGLACRIMDVDPATKTITIDQHLASGGWTPGAAWGYTLRYQDAQGITQIERGNVFSSSDNTFSLDIGIPTDKVDNFQVGNIVVVGPKKADGNVTEPFIVTAIRPTNDLKAELTLVRYDERVYDVDTNPMPPWNPSFGQDVIEGTLLYTSSLTAKSELVYQDRYPFTKASLAFGIEPASKLGTLDHIIIRYISNEGGSKDIAILPPDARSYVHIYSSLGNDFNAGRYQVIPVSQLGFQGQPKEVPTSKRFDTTSPQAVTGFNAEYQTSGNTLLSWDLSSAVDVIRYQIYYSATGTNPTLLGSTDWKTSSYSIPSHQEGTYYIKAIDSSGNESPLVNTSASWPVPGTLTDLQVHVDDNKAVLKWTPLTDQFVNQYLIYYSPNPKETDHTQGTMIGVTDAKTDTFPLTTVEGSYWVVARNTFGNVGAPARTSTFTPGVVAENLQIGQSLVYEGRFPFSNITLNWQGRGSPVAYRVYFRDKNGKDTLIQTTPGTSSSAKFSTIFDPEKHSGQFIIQPVTQYGTTGTEAQQNFVILKDTTPPVMPEAFFSNITGHQIELNWQPSISNDIEGYVIRYSPLFGHPQWAHGTVITQTDHITLNASVPARTGTYMLRAFDTSGNWSDTVYQRSAIETLPDINVVHNEKPEPAWAGTMSGLVKVGDHLEGDGLFSGASAGLGQVSSGTYTYSAPFDMGSIYEGIRIASKMQARGVHVGDYMASWIPLASARPLAGAEAEDWDAWIEYRVSDSPTVMADWVPLNSAEAQPLAGGSGNWSDWRRFYVADITARFIQFRIQTRSYEAHTKVLVDSGLVEIDMPDRIWSKEDIPVTAGEVVVPLVPAFREVRAAAVSIDGVAGGGHHIQTIQARVVSKTASSVTVQFFDSNNAKTTEDGQIDLIVTGYGKIGSKSI